MEPSILPERRTGSRTRWTCGEWHVGGANTGRKRERCSRMLGVDVDAGEETPQRVLFSELTGAGTHGAHHAGQNRTNERSDQCYMPQQIAERNGAAHGSYPIAGWEIRSLVSADEYQQGRYRRSSCRSRGKMAEQVGPAPRGSAQGQHRHRTGNRCIFSANAGERLPHLEAATPTDTGADYVSERAKNKDLDAPDGHSLVTAIGTNQAHLGTHSGATADHVRGYIPAIVFRGTERNLYLWVRTGTHFVQRQLQAVNLETHQYEDCYRETRTWKISIFSMTGQRWCTSMRTPAGARRSGSRRWMDRVRRRC